MMSVSLGKQSDSRRFHWDVERLFLFFFQFRSIVIFVAATSMGSSCFHGVSLMKDLHADMERLTLVMFGTNS